MKTLFWCALSVLALALNLVDVRAEETDVPLNKLPKAVAEAVQKKFPKATLKKAIQEVVDGHLEYEVTIQEAGKKIDVTLDEKGEIEGFEKEVALADLPKLVAESLLKEYPKGTPKSAEAVYEIEDGKEELEYFEVLLTDKDGKEIEAKIKANGKIVDAADEAKEKQAK